MNSSSSLPRTLWKISWHFTASKRKMQIGKTFSEWHRGNPKRKKKIMLQTIFISEQWEASFCLKITLCKMLRSTGVQSLSGLLWVYISFGEQHFILEIRKQWGNEYFHGKNVNPSHTFLSGINNKSIKYSEEDTKIQNRYQEVGLQG